MQLPFLQVVSRKLSHNQLPPPVSLALFSQALPPPSSCFCILKHHKVDSGNGANVSSLSSYPLPIVQLYIVNCIPLDPCKKILDVMSFFLSICFLPFPPTHFPSPSPPIFFSSPLPPLLSLLPSPPIFSSPSLLSLLSLLSLFSPPRPSSSLTTPLAIWLSLAQPPQTCTVRYSPTSLTSTSECRT